MTDEDRRQADKAARAPGDGGAAVDATVETTGVTADRGTQKAGDDDAAREAQAADGEVTSEPSGATDGETPDPGAGAEDTAPDSEPPGEAAACHGDELGEARREAAEHLDRALRAQAELENVRRRMERDLQNAHKFALERFVTELLPVKDSLELGLAASAEKGASNASIAEGVELTLRMFEQAMEKFGIEVVDPIGDPFDPEFHQAMTMQESDTAEPGTVLTVVQKGCLLNERLVRPAMVIVAK